MVGLGFLMGCGGPHYTEEVAEHGPHPLVVALASEEEPTTVAIVETQSAVRCAEGEGSASYVLSLQNPSARFLDEARRCSDFRMLTAAELMASPETRDAIALGLHMGESPEPCITSRKNRCAPVQPSTTGAS